MITNFIEVTSTTSGKVEKINPVHIITITDQNNPEGTKSVIIVNTIIKYGDGSIHAMMFPVKETKEEIFEQIKLSNKAFFVLMEQFQLSIMEKFHGK